MALVRHRECMFCHTQLEADDDYPVNLAFVDHIESKPRCNADFEQWTVNMRTDFKGD
jgi:hypothetical protein